MQAGIRIASSGACSGRTGIQARGVKGFGRNPPIQIIRAFIDNEKRFSGKGSPTFHTLMEKCIYGVVFILDGRTLKAADTARHFRDFNKRYGHIRHIMGAQEHFIHAFLQGRQLFLQTGKKIICPACTRIVIRNLLRVKTHPLELLDLQDAGNIVVVIVAPSAFSGNVSRGKQPPVPLTGAGCCGKCRRLSPPA